MVLLRPDLVFGKDSHIAHYMAQCALAGRILESVGSTKHSFRFNPVSADDIARAVTDAWNRDVSGKTYSVAGSEQHSLHSVFSHIAEAAGTTTENVAKYSPNMFITAFEEFTNGISHDQHMGRFASYYERKEAGFLGNESNYLKEFDLKESTTLSEYYAKNKLTAEEHVHPLFTEYKQISLN